MNPSKALYTTQPVLHLYTGNVLQNEPGKDGLRYQMHEGICLEPMGMPDAVHHPDFQSILLNKGETYQQQIQYCFSLQ